MDIISYTNISNSTLQEFLQHFYVSKSTIYKMFINECVTVNDEIVKPNYVLKKVDNIKINIEDFENNDITPWNYSINIIYEDKDLLIVNKPIGMLVHPDGNDSHTLANAISHYYQTKGLKRMVRHIHRLDVDTSGVLVYAKHFLAHSYLNHLVETKQFRKKYLAIVYGKVEKEGILEYKIGRDRHNSNRYIVTKNGKEAITKYKTIKYYNGQSFVEVDLETGRTHQIRVHFAHIGHALVGDKMYSKIITKNRLMLHSCQVSFLHPRSRKLVTYEAKTPNEFRIGGFL